MQLGRREFLRRGAALAAATAAPRALAIGPGTASARLEVYPDRRIRDIPLDYTGLSYETGELADARFFSPQNTELVGFIRRLGAHGVLRIGGNTSEYALWMPEGASPQAMAAKAAEAKSNGWTEAPSPVARHAIRNLADFVEALDWSLIWGLNLGKGSAQDAALEAACVAKYMGRRLLAFQIGNEPDLYKINGLRPKTWTFDDYLKQWREYAQAVRRKVSAAKFAAPDVAFRTDWISSFAAEAADQVVLLTGHYYAEGPPTNPSMTLGRLLRPNPRLEADIPKIMKASHEARRPFRMSELNSCYQGGKPGVSNTLGSAVWGADLMLHLAQSGYVGVNFHGGSRRVVKAGLGGRLPGASLETQGPSKYPGAFYTPIAGDVEVGFAARPLYYGMLLAGQFAGGTLVETRLESSGLNITAYGARAAGGLRVAIFNKDLVQAADVTLAPGRAWRQARLWRLAAPGPESTEGVTLAGAEVGHSGGWKPARGEAVAPSQSGYYAITLPPATSTLVFLED